MLKCKNMMYYQLVIYIVNYFLCINASDEYPTLKISQGDIRGVYMKSANGKSFSGFLGIPYAKPPIGELRFEPPQPENVWDHVFKATQQREMCPQPKELTIDPKGMGSEDCLYLNVFTPQTSKVESKTYPVMVFIHGGGYYTGSSEFYEPDYLIDYDVVYVNMNYRLGALGLFSTGDKVVPGNNAFKDQALALKWVNDNIHFFGGDSKKITLFGQSCGASGAQLHQFSPLSKGLFHNVIAQSGSIFNNWAMHDTDVVVKYGKQLAKSLNCPTDNNQNMVQCLKKIHPYKIIEMDKIFMKWEVEPSMPFRPVVEVDHEGAFLVENPVDMLKAGKHYQVPMITGINTEEGGDRVAMLLRSPEFIVDLNNNFSRVMSFFFQNQKADFNELRKFYFDNKNIDNSTLFQLQDMFGDFQYVVDGRKAALMYFKYSNQPVYFYVYGHKSSFSFSQVFTDSIIFGTSHMDDLLLLFPSRFFLKNSKRSALDKQCSILLLTLWTNFAKTGNPTPETNNIIQTKWEPVKTNDLEYCFIERNIHNAKNPFVVRMKFWEKFEATFQKKV